MQTSWRKYFLLLVTLISIDLISKVLASQYLVVHRNYGVIFGILNESSFLFRFVSLSTLGGFISFIVLVLLYLLSNKLNTLKLNLIVILSGILGNVFDRLVRGYTIDFIPLNFLNLNMAFNIADIYLTSGVCLLIYFIFRHDKKIWHPDNSRVQYLVNHKEQLRMAFKFAMASFITSFILGLFIFSYLHTAWRHSPNQLLQFLAFYTLVAMVLVITSFIIGIIISHRSAGPLYAFELYVERLLTGKRDELVLRDGDNYKHLEVVAKRLLEYFKNK
jgi:signal peptidase II